MKFRFALILIISMLTLTINASGQPVQAQSANEPTGFENVTLWVYPEYDDPRLLVMLEGKITAVTDSAQINFLVPQAAEMYATESRDAQGNHFGGNPDRKASQIPGWDELSYTLPDNAITFRVEYYDDIITGEVDKKISYDFRWLYPISDLRVVIQQPTKASDFNVSPGGINTREGSFIVTTYTKSNLTVDQSADQPLHFEITYTKTDPNPSLGKNTPASDSGSSNSVALTFIVLAIVIVAIFMLMFLMKMKRNTGNPAKYAVRRANAASHQPMRDFRKEKRPKTQAKEGHDFKFCNSCGKPITKSDKFCPNCGNKLGTMPKNSDDT